MVYRMQYEDQSEAVQRAADDLWRRTLSQVPSLFGKLVYLGSLRNTNADKYEHHGLSTIYGLEVADEVLRRSHEKAFDEWLLYSLKDQKADIDLFLEGVEGSKRETVQAWLTLKPFRNAMPSRVRQPDQELFLSDLLVLLQIFKAEVGASLPDPDA